MNSGRSRRQRIVRAASPPDAPAAAARPGPEELFEAAGHGVFVGFVAAGLSHLAWGLNVLIVPLAYGFGMSRLRSWPELTALLTMLGTTVAYFGVYDVIAADSPGAWLTIALSALIFVLWLVYVATVALRVSAYRAHALLRARWNAEDVERAQQWEEKYFARLRAHTRADNKVISWLRWWAVRSLLAFAAGAVVSLRWDVRSVASLAWAVALFHLIVLQRITRYRRRLRQPGAQLVVGRSVRRPILFLRPFALDALPVAPMEGRWSLLKVASWFDKRTFEELLSQTFERLGPVIAIGRPGEEVPALGAAREYADDASWRGLVLDRARAAQLVIMEVDASPGMEWELANVPGIVGLQRLLILLPPGEDLFAERSAAWYDRWAALRTRHGFLPEVSADTAAVLFDDDRPVVLRTGSSVQGTIEGVAAAWQQRHTSSTWSSDDRESSEWAAGGGPPGRGVPADLVRLEAGLRGLAARRSLLHGRYDPEALRLKQQRAAALVAKGDLNRAKTLLEEVARRRARVDGPESVLTLSALGDLANVQRLLGDLAGFRATAERVVEGAVHAFGEGHPATFAARTKLGLAMVEQGQLQQARALLEDALAGDSPAVAEAEDRRRAQRLLATVLTGSGDSAYARILLKQTLADSRAVLGDEHPEVYEATGMLAEVEAALGKHDKAARLARAALDGSERTFGQGTPLTLKYLLNAARLSADAGDTDQARTLAERAVDATRTALGPSHPDTLTALSVLGRARMAAGEKEPALDLFLLAWNGRRVLLGDRHPHTLAALSSAAALQIETGRTEEGLRNLRDAVAGYLDTLGPDHPHTRAVEALLDRRRRVRGAAGAENDGPDLRDVPG
jgi:tetratricopeptide (TPR) repeat protein